MSPRTAEPFHRRAITRVAGDPFQIIQDIIQTHVPQAMEERPGIFEHDAGLFAFIDQLRNEISHPLVAPLKNRRIMVIADALIIHHVFEIADDFSSGQIVATCRYQGLVHVQRNREGAIDIAEIDAAFCQEHRLGGVGSQGRFDRRLRPANVGSLVNIFRQFSHKSLHWLGGKLSENDPLVKSLERAGKGLKILGTESRRAKAAEKRAAVHDASRELAMHKIPAGFGLRLSFLPLLSRRILRNRHFESHPITPGRDRRKMGIPRLQKIAAQARGHPWPKAQVQSPPDWASVPGPES